mgnify:CR=1 FL=1
MKIEKSLKTPKLSEVNYGAGMAVRGAHGRYGVTPR